MSKTKVTWLPLYAISLGVDYGVPVVAPNDEAAKASFAEICKDMLPTDAQRAVLFNVGFFNPFTAKLKNVHNPVVVAHGKVG